MVVVFSRDYHIIAAIVTANGQTNIEMLELLTNSSTQLNNKSDRVPTRQLSQKLRQNKRKN